MTKDKQAFYTKFGFVQLAERQVDAMLLIREKARIQSESNR
jgi:hypothetical protein